MNYEESLQYIDQLNRKGVALGLTRIRVLLALLGDPQKEIRCIHVAGTNGKGSVCAMMDCALRGAGLRIGRYISPTLYDYRERIQVNGAYIGCDDVARLLTVVREACAQMARQEQEAPTVFEVETALAFLYFREQHCDYVLLEVGMGGRLDSTNVITQPVLSVITPISLDHTAMLGATLEAIATEKAGVIKKGSPVVIGPQPPEALQVLLARCAALQVQPVVVEANTIKQITWSELGQCFAYGCWPAVQIGLLGDYQCGNAAIALEALQLLQHRESALTDTVILEGLRTAQWPGRFAVICQRPLFIVDGAHNPAGAQALAQTLQQHFAGRRILLMMGVFRDKDYKQILQMLCGCSDTLFCFQPKQARGLESAALLEAAKPFYGRVVDAKTAERAVALAMAEATADDVVVSFGSLSTIKMVQEAVAQWEVQHGANGTS